MLETENKNTKNNFEGQQNIPRDEADQARQTRPNSGGVAEGLPRFDKGGVANFFTFYALKISLFRIFTLSD